MAKIYSVIDAHEAEQFIGQEGYFGDCLVDIKQQIMRSVLDSVRDVKENTRFRAKEKNSTWALFQPIEKTDLEIAKGLLGKVMKCKINETRIVFTELVFTELEVFSDGGVMLRSVTRNYYLKDVLEMFELVED